MAETNPSRAADVGGQAEAESSAKSGARHHVWIGLVISVACIFLSLRGVNLRDVVAGLRRADLVLVLVAAASAEVTILAKAVRWGVLFHTRKSTSWLRLFSILSIGLAINAFAPARLGELARAYLAGEAQEDSKTFALGTIGVEKVLDLLFLVLSLAMLFSQITLPHWLVGPSRATAITLAAAVLVLVVLEWKNEVAFRGIMWLHRFAPSVPRDWLARQVEQGLASLRVVRKPGVILRLLALSATVWVTSVATNVIVFRAMGLPLSVWASVLLLAVLQVGVSVPSSPGKIGVFHYLTVLTLTVFGIPKDAALGYAVILHLVVFLPIALVGAACLWHERTTWHRMVEAAGRLYRQPGRPA
jgi:glycosyltransferase 2 family protein